MPLVFNRAIDSTTLLGLWKIEETTEVLKALVELTPEEEAQYESFKSEVRKKQWLSYRALLKTMLGQEIGSIQYDTFGKPYLKNGPLISITHSGEYSAIIASKTNQVGIDIEPLKDRIHRITAKFLTPEEDKSIGDINRTEKLYIAWGAKEALYKLYGKPEVEFQRDIFIQPFDYLCSGNGKCIAEMKTPEGAAKYDISYEKIAGNMLVYTIAEVAK